MLPESLASNIYVVQRQSVGRSRCRGGQQQQGFEPQLPSGIHKQRGHLHLKSNLYLSLSLRHICGGCLNSYLIKLVISNYLIGYLVFIGYKSALFHFCGGGSLLCRALGQPNCHGNAALLYLLHPVAQVAPLHKEGGGYGSSNNSIIINPTKSPATHTLTSYII